MTQVHQRRQDCGLLWSARPRRGRGRGSESTNSTSFNNRLPACCHETQKPADHPRDAPRDHCPNGHEMLVSRLAATEEPRSVWRQRRRRQLPGQARPPTSQASTEGVNTVAGRRSLKHSTVSSRGSRHGSQRQHTQRRMSAAAKQALAILLYLASAISLASSNNTPPTPQTIEGEFPALKQAPGGPPSGGREAVAFASDERPRAGVRFSGRHVWRASRLICIWWKFTMTATTTTTTTKKPRSTRHMRVDKRPLKARS